MATTDLVKVVVTSVNDVLTIKSAPAPVVIGEMVKVLKGDKGETPEVPPTDDLEGFTTDPLAYYILASN